MSLQREEVRTHSLAKRRRYNARVVVVVVREYDHVDVRELCERQGRGREARGAEPLGRPAAVAEDGVEEDTGPACRGADVDAGRRGRGGGRGELDEEARVPEPGGLDVARPGLGGGIQRPVWSLDAHIVLFRGQPAIC